MTRFEQFNEMLFESYCKKSVSNAIKKERDKKAAKGQLEMSFSMLTDAVLYALSTENDGVSQSEKPCQIFSAQGINFPVYNEKLSQALSYLMPRDREIILLYFFKGLKDVNVAPLVHLSRPTVARRRKAAMKRLRELMEDIHETSTFCDYHAIYDSYAMRKFMGINFFEQDVPDATTLLHFRHLLEDKGIGKLFFDAINRCLERTGRMMRGGTIVDATLISAPSSTKNAEKKRDPKMHSVKKGNQWHFGMKCHTGVDAVSGFVHTVEATAANVHDVTVAAGLLREDDEVVYGDSAYLGIEKREEIRNSPQLSAIAYRINRRTGRLPRVSGNAIDWERHIENRKSAVRCKVEHPYRIVKNIFGFRKAVYRGLRKNLNRLHVLFASANLYMLARAGGSLSPA